jgi:hypothetical protein
LILRLIVATDIARDPKHLLGRLLTKRFALTLLLKCATLWIMTRDADVAEGKPLAIREELALDPVISAQEEFFGGPPKWPIEVRRMKDNLAFAKIIAIPLFAATARLIDAVKPMLEQCEAIAAAWKLALYPPVEESTSIVIAME